MNGYIGRENFDRFKIKTEFVNPLFPFKSADQTEKNVMEWIEKNFSEQKAAGVFGVMNSRVFTSKPILYRLNIQLSNRQKILTDTKESLMRGKSIFFLAQQQWRWGSILVVLQKSS